MSVALWLGLAALLAGGPAQGTCRPAPEARWFRESVEASAEIPGALARLLGPEALRIESGTATVGRLRMATPGQRAPSASGPDVGLGMPLPGAVRLLSGLRPGVLLAVLHADLPLRDARGGTIDPGAYTLRYGVQPGFKDHIGTSRYRDFAVLLPVGLDEGDPLDQRQTLALVARGHPRVLPLLPVEGAGPFPALLLCDAGLVLALELDGRTIGLAIDPA